MAQKLADILAGLQSSAGKAVEICGALSLWGQVVDERVNKHTEPIKISNRTLYVSTSSSAWAQELTFLKKEIMEKFNGLAGKAAIRDIKFSAKGGFASGEKAGG